MKTAATALDRILAIFDAATADLPGVERRKMFGCPCVFAGGHMLTGVHQSCMFLRLSNADRDEFLRLKGSAPFVPMPGRVMREYVVVSPALLADARQLRCWIERGLAYVTALPPKAPKTRAAHKSRATRDRN